MRHVQAGLVDHGSPYSSRSRSSVRGPQRRCRRRDVRGRQRARCRAARRAARAAASAVSSIADRVDEIGLLGAAPGRRAVQPRRAQHARLRQRVERPDRRAQRAPRRRRGCRPGRRRRDRPASVTPPAGRSAAGATAAATALARRLAVLGIVRRAAALELRGQLVARLRPAPRARTRRPRRARRRRARRSSRKSNAARKRGCASRRNTRLRWRCEKRDCSSQISCIGSEKRRGSAMRVELVHGDAVGGAALRLGRMHALRLQRRSARGNTPATAAARTGTPATPARRWRRAHRCRAGLRSSMRAQRAAAVGRQRARRFRAAAPAAGRGAPGRRSCLRHGRTGTASGIRRTGAPARLRPAAARARGIGSAVAGSMSKSSFAASRTARSMRTGSSR